VGVVGVDAVLQLYDIMVNVEFNRKLRIFQKAHAVKLVFEIRLNQRGHGPGV
jgi:hypothetical protein